MRTPLQKAAEEGQFDIAQYLINLGADVNGLPARIGGATALQFAAMKGYTGIVNLLLNQGAKVNALPALAEGRSALEAAAEHGRLDAVVTLLDTSVDIDGPGVQYYKSAIERAEENGHWAVVETLKTYL